ncbi:MAG TPA: 23S rRNA (adenine(2030)-N(6))-methyltransferase RlmJ [Rhizomicrobium sp.]
MNYRHAYHAGNFADVVKHVALTAILLHLRKKETPFAVIDTHAGAGLYDLNSEAARTTGEAEGGIAALRDLADGPSALREYLRLAASRDAYPGSPLIAAQLLRPQDRLVAIEKHPEDAARLKTNLAPFRKARMEEGDGYARLLALLPPPERRGLVLIDPPYEAPDEFAAAARALREAYRRFATGIYLVWFPVKSQSAADAFCGEVLACGAAKALRIDIAIAGDADRLTRAGLLVLNDPYGFEDAMRESLAAITPRLGDGAAQNQIARLAGG